MWNRGRPRSAVPSLLWRGPASRAALPSERPRSVRSRLEAEAAERARPCPRPPTRRQVILDTLALASVIKKTPVVVGNCTGAAAPGRPGALGGASRGGRAAGWVLRRGGPRQRGATTALRRAIFRSSLPP
jgi:hypothetical protein